MVGDIVYTQFPFADRKGFKARPGLVVSEADQRGDFYVLKISSSDLAREFRIPLAPGDFEKGGLPKPSAVDILDIAKTNKEMLVGYCGRLKADCVNRILKSRILDSTRTFSRLAHTTNRPGDDPLRLEAEKSKSEKQKAENLPAFPPSLQIPTTASEVSTFHFPASAFSSSADSPDVSAFSFPHSAFSSVPYAGRVFTEDEVEAAVSATLDFWLTLGPEGEAFEKELAALLGVKHSLLVNSGSSANLIALTCLTTHKLPDHKRIRPGDEVITCAAGFPTTVAPIIQNGCVPVFIDNDPTTGNACVDQLESAYSPGKTKAVMLAHTLGNPFDLGAVLSFCKKYDLWLIEDNCDALGCTYSMPVEMAKELGLDHLLRLAEEKSEKLKAESENSPDSETVSTFHFSPCSASAPVAFPATPSTSPDNDKALPRGCSTFPKLPAVEDGILTAYTGSFGDLSTQSFYPPHHLTMGEGGAVNIIRRASLKTYAESFRDWGRDCWCPSGKDNTCSKRFGWQLGELPEGYDHKYIYSHMGYNLKPLDPQAAIGRVQLRRLPAFIESRKQNWETLRTGLADLEVFFEFSLPTHATAWNKPENRNLKLEKAPSIFSSSPADTSAFSFQLSDFSWDSSACQTDCSWFGFMIRVKPSAPFTVRELATHLDKRKIGNRMLFGGNLLRQPAFVQLRKDNPNAFRVVNSTLDSGPSTSALPSSSPADISAFSFQPSAFSTLPGADAIMHTAIFLGTYPGLTQAQIDYEIQTIRDFVRQKSERLS
jgi:CDP-6-deoxy-D-xylo-4-hexulose-3-dehydrase